MRNPFWIKPEMPMTLFKALPARSDTRVDMRFDRSFERIEANLEALFRQKKRRANLHHEDARHAKKAAPKNCRVTKFVASFPVSDASIATRGRTLVTRRKN